MRSLRALFVLLSLFAGVRLSATTIREAYTRHMVVGQFQLLREFFTGEESTGHRAIFRTDPKVRTGQYFVLKLDTRLRDLPADTQIVLEVISTDDLKPVRYVFEVSAANNPGSRRVFLGLTGGAWPTDKRDALAWRIQLVQGASVLSEWKSFLWEMP